MAARELDARTGECDYSAATALWAALQSVFGEGDAIPAKSPEPISRLIDAVRAVLLCPRPNGALFFGI